MKKRKGRIPKSKKKSEATIMTPVAELSRSETNVHYNSVLIEEFRASQKFIIEYIDGAISALRAEMNARFDVVDRRIDLVEAAVKCNADAIRELQKDMREVKADIRVLHSEMREVKSDIKVLQGDMKEVKESLSRMVPRLDNYDDRLAALESTSA